MRVESSQRSLTADIAGGPGRAHHAGVAGTVPVG